MSQILLIDDDPSLHRLLGQYLEDAGFSVLHAESGQAGLKLLFNHRPDLVLLDVMMPRMDGWATCQRIRELTNDVPIIFLTAKGDEPDRLQGFRLGADDYVPKPFSFPELVARIEAVLRRAARADSGAVSNDILTCGPFRLDRARRLVTRDGQPIDLTPTEYRMLEVFMSRPGIVLSHEQLVTAIWGPEYADAVGHIRRYVWHLRRKIEPDPEKPQYFLTERGFGYRFRPC